MAHSSFAGGIHPFKGKRMSREKSIKEYLPTGELVFPLSQHGGAPAVPVAAVGERVLEGQLIARADGFLSANLHASVSGLVTAIEPRMTASGQMMNSIVVENDGFYEEMPSPRASRLSELSKEEILKRIQDAGVVGMGGKGFPTHVKLSVKQPERIKYVIVNCAECEPYLTSDYRRMVENPDWLVKGLRAVLKLFDKSIGILAIEDHKRDAITALQQAAGRSPRMEVHVVETKYPQGAECMLVYACTGRQISSSMLPEDVGCVVINVDTVCAIYHAVFLQKPLISRIVTVTGDAIQDPRNFQARIGTSYAQLVEAAGGFVQEPERLISGGPLMGTALTSLDVPVVKTSSAILAMSMDEAVRWEPSPCIHCGYCVTACPERLFPTKLAGYAERGKENQFRHYYGMECMGCGCCSFVCPAKRHLSQTIRAFRKELLEQEIQ